MRLVLPWRVIAEFQLLLVLLSFSTPNIAAFIFGYSVNYFETLATRVPRRISQHQHIKCQVESSSHVNAGDKLRRPPPPKEILDEALHNAECLIRDAGGCIDSIHFGHEWKNKYPGFSKDRFDGTQVSSFNKLLKVKN